VKLDLGCGKHPKDGFVGVDVRDFGQAIVCDLRDRWKWEDNSVEEVFSSHFVEHLNAAERIHFVNELYRVLKPGASAEIVVPHWGSSRAYGDLTHQWPPVSEHWFLYLSRDWREKNAPHTCDDYSCDFVSSYGQALDAYTVLRNQEYQQFAARYYRNACDDLVATLTKREA
jgi:predicted SAM-dependent methyltransferase